LLISLVSVSNKLLLSLLLVLVHVLVSLGKKRKVKNKNRRKMRPRYQYTFGQRRNTTRNAKIVIKQLIACTNKISIIV
jgi:hypothetical protein